MKLFDQITRIDLLNEFGISIVSKDFLPSTELIPVPSWLEHIIESRRKNLATLRSEKALSEGFIAPILMAVQETYRDKISVFSGEPLITEALSGVCDFLITKDPKAFDPQGGYFVLVEAKRQDLLSGISPMCG